MINQPSSMIVRKIFLSSFVEQPRKVLNKIGQIERKDEDMVEKQSITWKVFWQEKWADWAEKVFE